MSDTVLIVIVIIAALVVAGFIWLILNRRRTARLREDFGTEYEHLVIERGDSKAAEEELRARKERVEDYDLHDLSDRERAAFTERWQQVQSRFVDAPAAAVADAQELCDEVMHARGYPVGDTERQVADISVESPGVVSHYRQARGIAQASAKGEASTEVLRGAMKHYRELFDALLRAGDGNGRQNVTGNELREGARRS
ncbi:MAG: hypothetical protein ACREMD_13315 [Gemmatimonadota bacterium]